MAAATMDEVLEQEVALRAPETEQTERGPREGAEQARERALPADVYVRSADDGVWRQRRAEPEPVAEAPREPLTGAFDAIDELLRARDTLRARILAGEDLETIAKAMLVCVLVCAGAVGASVGLFRGGVQVVYAAVKVPMVLLLATAAVAPVYSAMKTALRHEVSLREDFAMVLCSLALCCLVAAALSPLLLLTILNGVGYHALIMGFVGLFGLGGLAGYVFFFKALNAQVVRGHRLIAVTLLTTLATVGCQLAWVMRPYVVRPKTEEVPFIRDIEGSFLDSVARSFDSARGVYDDAPTRVIMSRGRHGVHYAPARVVVDEVAEPADVVMEEPEWIELDPPAEPAAEAVMSTGRAVEVAP